MDLDTSHMIVLNPEAREVGTNVKAAMRVNPFLSHVNFFREYMYTRIGNSLLLGICKLYLTMLE